MAVDNYDLLKLLLAGIATYALARIIIFLTNKQKEKRRQKKNPFRNLDKLFDENEHIRRHRK